MRGEGRGSQGPDAVKFLEGLVVGDIAGIPNGSGSLSVFTNEQGGIIDDTVITKVRAAPVISEQPSFLNLLFPVQLEFLIRIEKVMPLLLGARAAGATPCCHAARKHSLLWPHLPRYSIAPKPALLRLSNPLDSRQSPVVLVNVVLSVPRLQGLLFLLLAGALHVKIVEFRTPIGPIGSHSSSCFAYETAQHT